MPAPPSNGVASMPSTQGPAHATGDRAVPTPFSAPRPMPHAPVAPTSMPLHGPPGAPPRPPRLPGEPAPTWPVAAPASPWPAQAEGSWRLPFLPFALPTPGKVIALHDEVRDLHPRVPHRASPSSTPGDNKQRSPIAEAAVKASFIGGGARSGLDLLRTVKKFPEAHRAGRLGMAVRQAAIIAPDTRLIDPTIAHGAKVDGRTFTRIDHKTYVASSLLGVGLSAVQFGSSIPNLWEALSEDGPAGLVGSTSGRSGVLQFAGGGLGLGLFGAALLETRGQDLGKLERFMAAAKSPTMTRPWATRLGIASGFAVMANEVGFFDFLNADEKRSVPAVLRDATRKIPVVNDSTLRTTALGLGTLGLGISIGRTAHAAGTLSAVSKGRLVGAAALVGLLGAQLLGGLGTLDAPS